MLDNRLNMVYGLIPDCKLLCDIGTDHCKLASHAVINGKASRAAATDVRRGPLAAAQRTVEANGLSDRIELILSDGFKDIPNKIFDSADCFVIAGMGGELIISILKGRKTDKPLILQPMSAIYELSAYLSENGYATEKRVFCRDGDRLYTALICRYDGKVREFSPFEGAVKNESFRLFIAHELARTEHALHGMSMGKHTDTVKRSELEMLKKLLKSEEQHEN